MSYESILAQNKEWMDQTFEKLDKKLSRLAVKSRDKIPYGSKNGVHDDKAAVDITYWTNGFWGGLMWLMYAATGKDCYLDTAKNADRILDGAWKKLDGLHHDVGFMWHITAGACYRLTGDAEARRVNRLAATTPATHRLQSATLIWQCTITSALTGLWRTSFRTPPISPA